MECKQDKRWLVYESDSRNKSSDESQIKEDKSDSKSECHDEEEQTGQLIPYVTHTVVFKCIGSVSPSVRDAHYQNTPHPSWKNSLWTLRLGLKVAAHLAAVCL